MFVAKITSYHSWTRAWHRGQARRAIVPSRCRRLDKTAAGLGFGEPEVVTTFCNNNNFDTQCGYLGVPGPLQEMVIVTKVEGWGL